MARPCSKSVLIQYNSRFLTDLELAMLSGASGTNGQAYRLFHHDQAFHHSVCRPLGIRR